MARRKGGTKSGGYKAKGSTEGAGPTREPHQKPKKPPLTHFLCFPLVTEKSRPQLEASVRKLREGIAGTGETGDARIPEGAVRSVGTLHLTLGVMSLMTDERVEGAIALLKGEELGKLLDDGLNGVSFDPSQGTKPQDANRSKEPAIPNDAEANKPSASDPDKDTDETEIKTLSKPVSPPPTTATDPVSQGGPIVVSLSSLNSMHAPRKTTVLYTSPTDPTNRLLPLGKMLRKTFTDAEFLIPDDRPLKLHATMINTIYANPRSGRGPRNRPKPAPETATEAAEAGTDHDEEGESAADPGVTTVPEAGPGQEEDADNQEESKDEAPSTGKPKKARRSRAPLRLDARALIEEYKDIVWAEDVQIEKIAICKMGAKKTHDKDGNITSEEYEEVVSIPLGR